MRNMAPGLVVATVLSLAGCASLSDTQQRNLNGAATGSAAGYTIGVTTGAEKGSAAVVGASAGALGGYLYEKSHQPQR